MQNINAEHCLENDSVETIDVVTKTKKVASSTTLTVYKIVENALSMEEGVKDVNSIKIVSIGTDKYLGIVKVDYLDSFTDLEIIEINKNIEESVKTSDARFSHLYLIPA